MLRSTDPRSSADRRALLSKMLKTLRRLRGVKATEAAERMGMALRSYEHFESGQGRLDAERIHRFAEAIDVDPYGIVLGLELSSLDFALRCADNKAATILMLALQDFDTGIGDNLRALDPHTLMSHFTSALDGLKDRASVRRAEVEAWMTDPALARPPEGS